MLLGVLWVCLVSGTPLPEQKSQTLASVPGANAPEYWFLTADEIKESRGGHERPVIATFTSENKIDVMVDGAEFMANVADDIAATEAGDFIHMAPYQMDHRLVLKPNASDPIESEKSNIQRVLQGANERNVDTKILVNDWNYYWAPKSMLFEFKNVPMVSDKRFPFMGSHHQKTMVVMRHGEAVGYVGGIDFAPDRWDTPLHNASNPNKQLEEGAQTIDWHDVAVRFHGPAVNDIERSFWERWNAPDDPSLTTPQSGKPYEFASLPVAHSPSSMHVQLLRTYPCVYGNYNFAPKGETSILKAMLKAISKAEKYLYIETPFITSIEIANAIAKALPRLEAVVILTIPCRMLQKTEEMERSQVDNSENDLSFFIERQFIGGIDYYAKEFMKTIRVPGHEHKVNVFVSKTAPDRYLYVHAKLMIVDDHFALIGSQNINRRSLTHDSEISVGIVDAQVDPEGRNVFARDLRRRLWSEHLNLDPDHRDIASFHDGIAEWKRQADSATQRPRHFQVDVVSDPLESFLSSDEVWGLWDPEGRCDAGATNQHDIQSLLSATLGHLVEQKTKHAANS